ncbi:MAG TPA: hypothetical protein VII01_17440, partial [Solirubrobacteraceae bacterium]
MQLDQRSAAAFVDAEVIAGVRLLILGGEACPAELGWRLAARLEVWNTYGPTGGVGLGRYLDPDLDAPERADATASANQDAYLSSLWCSKAALSKALGDALRYDPSRLDSP